MNTVPPNDRLQDLIDAACRGTIDDERLIELAAILADDDRARQLYADYFQLHTELYWLVGRSHTSETAQQRQSSLREHLEPETGLPSGVSRSLSPPLSYLDFAMHGAARYVSSGWPVAYLVATVILGVGFLIGTVVHVSQPTQVVHQPAPLPSPLSPLHSSSPFVGRITGMVDCQWSDPQTEAVNGANVPLGRKYALSSGLMEITYDTGAKVILQGPVTYEVESSAGGFLSLGKLTARVEKKEEGRTKNEELSGSNSSLLIPHSYFAVRTPTATVTDLGTEFGVEVQESGATATHVFAGTVEVQTPEHNNAQGKMIRLSENESALVEKQEGSKDVTVRRVAADSASYVRAGQLPKLAEERRLKELRRWQAYSQELRRDPSLVAYYDFQQKPGSPAVLPNVAANGDKSLDGVVENATWTNGRMPGKHALRFVMPGSGVRVAIPGEFESLTLAAWVNFETVPNGHKAILMTDDWGRPGQIHWQFGGGVFSLGVYPPKNDPDGWYAHEFQIAPEAANVGKWRALAFVYDGPAKQATFFIDGKEVGKHAIARPIPLVIGGAQIGAWNGLPDTEFPGRIDELLISRRPWTSMEVERHCQEGIGKPVVNTNSKFTPKEATSVDRVE